MHDQPFDDGDCPFWAASPTEPRGPVGLSSASERMSGYGSVLMTRSVKSSFYVARFVCLKTITAVCFRPQEVGNI